MKTFAFILLSVATVMVVTAEQRLKMALPDGVFPEDKVAHQRIQHPSEEGVTSMVPMIIMEDNDFVSTSSMKTPLKKHQMNKHVQKKKGYKHLGAASNERSFRPMLVTPLLPKDQKNVKQEAEKQQQEATTADKENVKKNMRSKKLIAVSDKGIYQPIDLPIPQKTPETQETEEQVLPQGVTENRIVVLDKMGKMKFIDIPYYNRASSSA